MSATADSINEYLTEKHRDVTRITVEPDCSFINQLTFYNSSSNVQSILDEIPENEKAVVFINDVKQLLQLHQRYQESSLFYCSPANRRGYRNVNQQAITDFLANGQFHQKYLFTTSALDNGVNIKDNAVKHVMIDMKDLDTFLQCMGRRRIENDNDKINVYVRNFNNQSIGYYKKTVKAEIDCADFLAERGQCDLVDYFGASLRKYPVVYDAVVNGKVKKQIMEPRYFYLKRNLALYNQWLSMGNSGYMKYIKKILQLPCSYYMETDTRRNDALNYLNRIEGQELDSSLKRQLIDTIDYHINGRKVKSMDKLNFGLEQFDFPFVIENYRTNERRYWVVKRKLA